MPQKFDQVAKDKWRARIGRHEDSNLTYAKVNFNYDNLKLEFLPSTFPKVINYLYAVEKSQNRSVRCLTNSPQCRGKKITRLHYLDVHLGKRVEQDLHNYLSNLSSTMYDTFSNYLDSLYIELGNIDMNSF